MNLKFLKMHLSENAEITRSPLRSLRYLCVYISYFFHIFFSYNNLYKTKLKTKNIFTLIFSHFNSDFHLNLAYFLTWKYISKKVFIFPMFPILRQWHIQPYIWNSPVKVYRFCFSYLDAPKKKMLVLVASTEIYH